MKIKLENSELYKKAINAVIKAEKIGGARLEAGIALAKILRLQTLVPFKIYLEIRQDMFRYIESRYSAIFDAVSSEGYFDLTVYDSAAWSYLLSLRALDDMAHFLMGEEFNEGREND